MNYLKGIIFFTLLLVLSRVVPHPPNFTPILAGIIFIPFIKKDFIFSMIVPIVVMLISDSIIGMHSLMLWTYLPILILSFLAFYFHQDSFRRVINLAIFSPIIFFILSNFGVWVNSAKYSRDFSGLVECYIYAIPFYASSAISCILFSIVFYLIRQLIFKKIFLPQ